MQTSPEDYLLKNPDLLFLKSSGDHLNRSEFLKKIKIAAKKLKETGLQKGDVVLLSLIDDLRQIILFFAVWANQAIIFPVNPRMPDGQIKNLIQSSRAKFILTDSGEALNNITCIGINNFFSDQNLSSPVPGFKWDITAPATIILTSGSSGNPKLVVHSLQNHIESAKSVNTYFGIKESDCWLLALPLYHVAGLAILFRCLISTMYICIAKSKANPFEDTSYAADYVSLVPAQLSAVLENKKVLSHLKSYKAIFLGGSAIPRTVLNKLIPHNFKIYSSYGLTEMASTVAIKYISGGDTSQAQILSGNTVKINNKKELLIKGPSLFSGYLINGKINKATDDEGWFHSKDLGEITDGKITVLGRVDNIFISGGENISPEEIEKELLKINGIYQAIVVPKKDKKYGERPVAFIELKSDLNEEIIKSHLKKHLPGFKIPVHILPWPVNRNSHALKINRNYFKTLIV